MLNYAMRPAITPLTLLLTVIGFIFFWPLGLAMFAYMIFGSHLPAFRQHYQDMRSDWSRDRSCGPGARRGFSRGSSRGGSGNVAFDDYRDKEMQRLEEERRRLDEELRDFRSYMSDLRRARDAEEFDRFMRERTQKRRSDGVDL